MPYDVSLSGIIQWTISS